MKEERFVIADQKMTELQIDLGNEDRKTIYLRRNFSGSDHKLSFSCPLTAWYGWQSSNWDAPVGQTLVSINKVEK
jgi:hypothetical protein